MSNSYVPQVVIAKLGFRVLSPDVLVLEAIEGLVNVTFFTGTMLCASIDCPRDGLGAFKYVVLVIYRNGVVYAAASYAEYRRATMKPKIDRHPDVGARVCK